MSETTTNTAPKAAKTPKAPKTKTTCWCGCGGLTNGRFVPGHDAKFHGQAKAHARAIVAAEEGRGSEPEMPVFVHADAEADFVAVCEKHLPKARQQAKEEAAKAERKAQREADKALLAAAKAKAAAEAATETEEAPETEEKATDEAEPTAPASQQTNAPQATTESLAV